MQPDLHYGGGLIRATKVAWMAAAAGLKVVPHMSGGGLGYLDLVQFASFTPNSGEFMEFKGNTDLPVACATRRSNASAASCGVRRAQVSASRSILLRQESPRRRARRLSMSGPRGTRWRSATSPGGSPGGRTARRAAWATIGFRRSVMRTICSLFWSSVVIWSAGWLRRRRVPMRRTPRPACCCTWTETPLTPAARRTTAASRGRSRGRKADSASRSVWTAAAAW